MKANAFIFLWGIHSVEKRKKVLTQFRRAGACSRRCKNDVTFLRGVEDVAPYIESINS